MRASRKSGTTRRPRQVEPAVAKPADSAIVEAVPVREPSSTVRRYRKPLIVAGSGLLVVLIAFGVWSAVSGPSDPDSNDTPNETVTTVPDDTTGVATTRPPEDLGPK